LHATVSTWDSDTEPGWKPPARAAAGTVAGEYVDVGERGSKRKPVLNSMLKVAHALAFDAVVVRKLDRLGSRLPVLVHNLNRFIIHEHTG
jgi:DNA invertase Pin-like site-specific DNA recombinase